MVKKAEDKNTKPTCFVIMPISTPKEYEDKHFDRVYEHLIKPACEPEYAIIRADEVRSTNYIIIDVLNRIIDSDLVICDLSSRNPNVLYELGIRQAFNLPVVLLKDKRSDRIFDIQGLRTVDYDDTLRIDIIKNDIDSLKGAIKETSSQASKDINSLIQLLGVKKAELSPNTELSPELSLILGALQDISQRINRIENRTMGNRNITIRERVQKIKYRLPNGEVVNEGEDVYDKPNGEILGTFHTINNDGIIIRDINDGLLAIPPDTNEYNTLTTFPF